LVSPDPTRPVCRWASMPVRSTVRPSRSRSAAGQPPEPPRPRRPSAEPPRPSDPGATSERLEHWEKGLSWEAR
jgi:hypothetical protein